MLQRLALFDNALGRDDDSEVLAIQNASPKKAFTEPDYCELLHEIAKIRLCNMIVRLGYITHFDLLLQDELEVSENKSNLKAEADRLNQIKLVGYLYVRATDAWNMVNEELGLRPNFESELGERLFSIDLLRWKDEMIREFAFTEAEAMAYTLKATGKDDFQTLEQEVVGYREIVGLSSR